MKTARSIMLSLAVICSAGAVHALDAPASVNAYLITEIPGFMTGPSVDVLVFPWAIPIGGGRYNWLGVGATGGLYFLTDPDFTVCPIVQGVFAGRFGVVKGLPIDWDVRLGLFSGPNGSTMVATTGLSLYVRMSKSMYFRPYLGYNIFPGTNPYTGYADVVHSFAIELGFSFPQKGWMKAREIFNK